MQSPRGHKSSKHSEEKKVQAENLLSVPDNHHHRGRSRSSRDAGLSRHRDDRSVTKHTLPPDMPSLLAENISPPSPIGSSSSRSSSRSLSGDEVKTDPFDQLRAEQEYKVSNFKGSCPGMPHLSSVMITTDRKFPEFHHTDSTLKVLNIINQNQKRLRLKATVLPTKTHPDAPGGNCDYGVTGTYEVDMVLKKNPNGKIICTSVEGVSGKIKFPMGVLPALHAGSAVTGVVSSAAAVVATSVGSLFWRSTTVTVQQQSVPAPSVDWDDVRSYNTGSKEQDLQVDLTVGQDRTLEFKTYIDPNKLKLEGNAGRMLTAITACRLAFPAVLEATVQMPRKEKSYRENHLDREHRSLSKR